MNVLATLLTSVAVAGLSPLPFSDANANTDERLAERSPSATTSALYPPNDPEGPDDAGTGEGEGSGGSSGGSSE